MERLLGESVSPGPGEGIANPIDPYGDMESWLLSDTGLDPLELGLPRDARVNVRRWTHPGARTAEEAKDLYDNWGMAAMHSGYQLAEGVAVADLKERFAQPTLDLFVELSANPTIVERREMEMDDGTIRSMLVVKPQNVVEHFKPVQDLHGLLLPTYEAIGGPGTIISKDPDEMSVINGMDHDPEDSDDNDARVHGMHIDRVDLTSLKPALNIGPGGQLVVVSGYREACRDYGLDRHGNAKQNLGAILARNPDAITLLIHDVNGGEDMFFFNSATHFHYVMRKKTSDIVAARKAGIELPVLANGNLLSRLMLNDAAETPRCQADDLLAKEVEAWLASPDGEKMRRSLGGAVLLKRAFEEVGTPEDRQESIEDAIKGRRTASALYHQLGNGAIVAPTN